MSNDFSRVVTTREGKAYYRLSLEMLIIYHLRRYGTCVTSSSCFAYCPAAVVATKASAALVLVATAVAAKASCPCCSSSAVVAVAATSVAASSAANGPRRRTGKQHPYQKGALRLFDWWRVGQACPRTAGAGFLLFGVFPFLLGKCPLLHT